MSNFILVCIFCLSCFSLPTSAIIENNKKCLAGIVVSDGSDNKCVDKCDGNNPCLNGGICRRIEDNSDFECICKDDYFGKFCGDKKVEEVTNEPKIESNPNNINSSFRYYYVTINGYVHESVDELENGKIPQLDKSITAWAIYNNSINTTGWATLEIHTVEGVDDELQAYSAGLIEATLTGELIVSHWKNLHSNDCSSDVKYCSQFKSFLKENRDFVNEKIAQLGKKDAYWHQVNLVYQQLYGLQVGFDKWLVKSEYYHDQELQDDPVDLYIMNLGAESDALEMIIGKEGKEHILGDGHCSALIKPLSDGSDLLVAHNTWSDYDSMLRIMKKYDFKFRSLPTSNKLIPGNTYSFSSYPGDIFSEDDFYVLSTGLVVLETTNENYNDALYKNIHSNGTVFEFIRNIIANRLATNGKEWTSLFSEYNSGTYNNQYMIVDYKLYEPGMKVEQLKDGTLWVVEQMPTLIHAQDVTQVLREKGYWASYNVAYFDDIFNISHAQLWLNKYGDYYSHAKTARAQIFARDEGKVTDMKSMFKLMRYNDFKNDPLSRCEVYNQTCEPPYSADNTISARNDLNDEQGNYPLKEWTHRGEGAIDLKVTNHAMAKSLQMLAISGPTYQQQPVFQWSDSNIKDLRHEGHPDRFDFPPYHVKWHPKSWEEMKDLIEQPEE